MEQLIAIVVFAICAAVCVHIIVSAHVMTQDAIDTRNALTLAENTAESFRASQGSAFLQTSVVISDMGAFTLHVHTNGEDEHLSFADIYVYRTRDELRLVELSVATRRTPHE